MATCRECLHQVLCDTYSRMGVTDVPADDVTICELFNPKSDYVKRERGEWISVKDKLPNEWVSVLGYMTDAGEFPPVRECYLVGKNFFFPA